MPLRLGKLFPRRDPRTLKLARYLAPSLPPAPLVVDNTAGIRAWGMMKNDALGDCTIAACGHAMQVVTANTRGLSTVTDAQVERYYSWWDGYVSGDASTDNGGVCLDVLNNWRKWGFAGNALLAYAAPAPGSAEHIRKSIQLFGFVYIGIGLPLTAQEQVGKVWDVVPPAGPRTEPYSWGGHCVVVCAYDPEGLTCITWGGLQRMTWPFWAAYCDESYALLLGYRLGGELELALSMNDLQSDLTAVTG